VEDAHEDTDEVVGVGVGAEIAAGDGALDGGYEGGVDERAGAFEEAHGTAGDGVHRGNDEPFSGDMVDEEKHPGAKRFKRRQGGSEALFGCRKLFDFAAVDGFDEVVLRARCDGRYAGFERVDAKDAGVGADRAGADRGFDEYDVLTIAVGLL
jgi:hypothetical protein